MSTATETVYVHILDKEYQIACPPRERDALLQAARELDERMRTIKTSGNVIGLERIAVMAAINLCHELLSLKRDLGHQELDDNLLQRLSDKLDQALDHLG